MSTAIRWTSADLAGFPDDGKRREIIDGEMYVSKQPHLYHQIMGDGLVTALSIWSTPRGAGVAVSAPGVILSPADDVAPDIAWISTERFAAIHSAGKLYAAPELIVEILSPGNRNKTRDREVKRKLYSRHGVSEYWIADWVMRSIEVYRRVDGQLALLTTLFVGDTLTSPLLPEFLLPLETFFSRIPAGATYTDDEV